MVPTVPLIWWHLRQLNSDSPHSLPSTNQTVNGWESKSTTPDTKKATYYKSPYSLIVYLKQNIPVVIFPIPLRPFFHDLLNHRFIIFSGTHTSSICFCCAYPCRLQKPAHTAPAFDKSHHEKLIQCQFLYPSNKFPVLIRKNAVQRLPLIINQMLTYNLTATCKQSKRSNPTNTHGETSSAQQTVQ